jgi:methionyl-tRNA synthetase
VPRDLIRFHLAATSPEFQRTNFSNDALAKVTQARLVWPWNRIAAKADEWLDRGPLPVSERSRAAAARIVERFAACYELPDFSLNRATETLTEQLARLERWHVVPADSGDFYHEVQTVLRCAAPILIDLAAEGLEETSIPGAPVHSVTPRRLPRLRPVR